MSSLNLNKMITEMGDQLSDEATGILKENKDLFENTTKAGFRDLLINVKAKNVERVNASVYSAMLRNLSDKEFIALRVETTESLEQLAALDARKHKLVEDLVDLGEKVVIDHAIRYAALIAIA